LNLAAGIFKEAAMRGFTKLNVLDIGGGFPAPYNESVRPFEELAHTLNSEFARLFPPHIEILAEPGRFLVATAASLVVKIIGSAVRDDKRCYYIDDGVYHTFSGIIFDHCQYHLKAFKKGQTQICSVFGPTCDALDTISLAEELPDMKLGDLLYCENIGAYSHASSTSFNGFPPAKVLHINV
jgi:ornithine decarboxylase